LLVEKNETGEQRPAQLVEGQESGCVQLFALAARLSGPTSLSRDEAEAWHGMTADT